MDFNIKDNNKDNYLCKNLFNDSFDIPKEKSLFCDIKDTKLNSTYSFCQIPTSITSNSNILHSSSRKRPYHINFSLKKIKKKFKQVTFNEDNLVEYIYVDSYKNYNTIEKKNNNAFKGLNLKDSNIHCCLIY